MSTKKDNRELLMGLAKREAAKPKAKPIYIARPFDGLLEERVSAAEFTSDPFDAEVRASWKRTSKKFHNALRDLGDGAEGDCEYCGGSGLTTEGDCGCTS